MWRWGQLSVLSPRDETREHENTKRLVQEGTGNTVLDERAGGLRAARLGTVEPVPDALDLPATESAIAAIFK